MRSGDHVQSTSFRVDNYSPTVRMQATMGIPLSLKKDKSARLNFIFMGVTHAGKPEINMVEWLASKGFHRKPDYVVATDVPQPLVERVQEHEQVAEALAGFSQDPTGNNGFEVVRAVILALATTQE